MRGFLSLRFFLRGLLGDENAFLQRYFGWLCDRLFLLYEWFIVEDQLEITFSFLSNRQFLS